MDDVRLRSDNDDRCLFVAVLVVREGYQAACSPRGILKQGLIFMKRVSIWLLSTMLALLVFVKTGFAQTTEPAPTVAQAMQAVTDKVYPAIVPMLGVATTLAVIFGVAFFILGRWRHKG